MAKKHISWLALGLLVLFACADDKVSMPVEGGNPALATRLLTVTVENPAGAKASRALVKVWFQSKDSLGGLTLVDSVYADEKGIARVAVPIDSPWTLEARHVDGAFARSGSVLSDSAQCLLSLRAPSRIHGVWAANGEAPPWIGLQGLPYRASLAPDGRFSLLGLPAGEHLLQEGGKILAKSILARLALQGDDTLNLDTLGPSGNSLLVDDFSVPGLSSVLSHWHAGSSWYVLAPNYDNERLDSARLPGRPGSGLAWCFRMANLPDTTARRGTLGLRLGSQIPGITLDSLEFYAKGPARLRFRYVTNGWGDMWQEIQLDSAWKRYTLRPEDAFYSGGYTDYAQVLGATDRFEWNVLGFEDVQWCLDDVRAYGWKAP